MFDRVIKLVLMYSLCFFFAGLSISKLCSLAEFSDEAYSIVVDYSAEYVLMLNCWFMI